MLVKTRLKDSKVYEAYLEKTPGSAQRLTLPAPRGTTLHMQRRTFLQRAALSGAAGLTARGAAEVCAAAVDRP